MLAQGFDSIILDIEVLSYASYVLALLAPIAVILAYRFPGSLLWFGWACLVGAAALFYQARPTTKGLKLSAADGLALGYYLLPLVLLGATSLIVGRAARRRSSAQKTAFACASCGYDLRGIQGHCPECGHAYGRRASTGTLERG